MSSRLLRGYTAFAGLLLLLTASTGCARKDGGGWAEKRFGKAGAAEILQDMQRLATRRYPGHDQTPFLPRPYVILEEVPRSPGSEAVDYRFDRSNRSAVGVADAPARVRAFVLVRREMDSGYLGKLTIKRRQVSTLKDVPIQIVTILDRETTYEYHHVVEGHDEEKLLTFLVGLPEVQPRAPAR